LILFSPFPFSFPLSPGFPVFALVPFAAAASKYVARLLDFGERGRDRLNPLQYLLRDLTSNKRQACRSSIAPAWFVEQTLQQVLGANLHFIAIDDKSYRRARRWPLMAPILIVSFNPSSSGPQA
jgi:hypothetical protein